MVGRDARADGRLIFNAVGGVEWAFLSVAQKRKSGRHSAGGLVSVRDH
jgi:hypothetical protein